MASTPVPPGTPLEAKNYIDIPRPFKSGKPTRSGNRRTKNLKQILAAERDAAFGIEGTGIGKRKGKKTAWSALQSETATAVASTQGSRAGSDEIPDADTTMGNVTQEDGAQALATATAAADAAAKRKRDLPSCESHVVVALADLEIAKTMCYQRFIGRSATKSTTEKEILRCDWSTSKSKYRVKEAKKRQRHLSLTTSSGSIHRPKIASTISQR